MTVLYNYVLHCNCLETNEGQMMLNILSKGWDINAKNILRLD